MKKKGIDISEFQGKISKENFQKAKKSGVEFVILRLGYTGSKTKKPTLDACFEHNYKNAVAAGLPVGVYYYSLATNNRKAMEEAQFCISNIINKQITYPVYIDMEDPNYQTYCTKNTLASVCDSFCRVINENGYNAGVYASVSWFNNKIGKITEKHTKWVAQYYKKCEYKGNYDMWQYSSLESVPGIANHTDVNYCYTNFIKPAVEIKYPKLPLRGYFKKGDRGNQVRALQILLNALLDTNIAIDGVYGEKTEKAVIKFQERYDLDVDGLFGRKSLKQAKSI